MYLATNYELRITRIVRMGLIKPLEKKLNQGSPTRNGTSNLEVLSGLFNSI